MDKIGDSAFSGCTNLREVVYPKQVGETGNYMFFNCDGLADENGFVIVNGILYSYCGDSDIITVPDTAERIGDRAFETKIVEMTCMGEMRQLLKMIRIWYSEFSHGAFVNLTRAQRYTKIIFVS